ncbi:hypothetical protein PIB30_083143 [Stylosanthes scabra]|uniref:Secreted protein n=1 Tax=Stylosanthes scabra TaxID=79078 RepID=A0ABU6URK6_9FABA|nr:hypothetical protein [Stylosanthes scabra]
MGLAAAILPLSSVGFLPTCCCHGLPLSEFAKATAMLQRCCQAGYASAVSHQHHSLVFFASSVSCCCTCYYLDLNTNTFFILDVSIDLGLFLRSKLLWRLLSNYRCCSCSISVVLVDCVAAPKCRLWLCVVSALPRGN